MGGGGGNNSGMDFKAPSPAEMVGAWVQALPQVYDTQLQYDPKFAESQINIANKYWLPYSQAAQRVQESLYPITSSFQESLGKQAQEGMQIGLPKAVMDEYRDMIRGELGTNAGSPIGAEYASRQMIGANEQEKDKYRNLALSLTNRVPITTTTPTRSLNWLEGFSPIESSKIQMQGFGYQADAMSRVQSANAAASASKYGSSMSMLGNVFNGLF